MTANGPPALRPARLLGAAAVLAVLAPGCVDTRVATADQVRESEGEELTLYLHDGRRITLPAGAYEVRRDSAGSIRGTGRLLGLAPNDLGSRWQGTVMFAEIDSVRAQKDSDVSRGAAIGIAGLTALAGGMMFFLWLAFRNGVH